MATLHVGRHGVIHLVALFLLLGTESVLIWLTTGTLPAIEFSLGTVLLVVFALAVREAGLHSP